MRNIVGLAFLILYLVALIRPLAPLLEYYSNQDFFAKVLCINQDKPELACNGQCILMQKLKKANTETNSPVSEAPMPKVNLKDYPIGFVSFLATPIQKSELFDVIAFSPVFISIKQPVP